MDDGVMMTSCDVIFRFMDETELMVSNVSFVSLCYLHFDGKLDVDCFV